MTAIPLWPGVLLTVLAGLVYCLVGSGGGAGYGRSSYQHHTLTASAWLHGRFYATADELQKQYLLGWFERSGRPYTSDEPVPGLRERYRQENLRAQTALDARKGRNVQDPAVVRDIQSRVQGFIDKAPYHDWVHLNGKYYAYWPPLPALVMLPFVAIAGTEVSDVLVGNILGTLSVFFIFLMLRALKSVWPDFSTIGCVGLTVLYAFGTCHLYQACIGQVWYLTQLSGTLFLIIATWFGLRAMKRPPLIVASGAALGLGFLGRNTIILAAPFFAAALFIGVRRLVEWKKPLIAWGSGFVFVLLLAIGVQLGFNHARFGNPLDFGQGYLADQGGAEKFKADFHKFGRFHPHYLSRNTYYYFVNPMLRWYSAKPKALGWSFDSMGNSLFLISPAMAYMFFCWRDRRSQKWFGADWPWAGAILGVVLIVVGVFVFRGNKQFSMLRVLDSSAQGANSAEVAEHWAWSAAASLVMLAWLPMCIRRILEGDWLLAAVLAGALPGTMALMFFHGTGWYQFGQRYLLDTMPFLLILAGFGMRGRLTTVSSALILASIVANAWGTYRFCLEQT